MPNLYKPFALTGILVGYVAVASCASEPLVVPREVPAAFEHSLATSPNWPDTHWYDAFGDPQLSRLIEDASEHNLDLAAALARVQQADAHARAAGAALLPQIDAGPSVTHSIGGARGHSASETDWSLLANASYEVDLWGKNAAARDAARFSAFATGADRETVGLSVTSSVANEYVRVLSLRERLDLARRNLQSNREVLAAIQARFDAGAASAAELAMQRAAVANAQLTVAPLEQQEMEARAALAVLLGRPPEQFQIENTSLDTLREPLISPGLPAELLVRRPDIVAAEANLQAAHADLAAARAAFFPTVTLTASAGVQNPAVQAAVTTLEGTGYSVAATAALVQTIFDAGRRQAAKEEAQAKEAELLANYRAAVLNALEDVETALSAMEHLDAQQASQRENIEQSGRAYEAARLRYQAGSGDYLSVLDAQRTMYAAQDQYSQYRLERLQASIALFKALGGGWAVASGANQP
jgi:NodT family efflux transporter outer membrane factor (OMF) lipoprotein